MHLCPIFQKYKQLHSHIDTNLKLQVKNYNDLIAEAEQITIFFYQLLIIDNSQSQIVFVGRGIYIKLMISITIIYLK